MALNPLPSLPQHHKHRSECLIPSAQTLNLHIPPSTFTHCQQEITIPTPLTIQGQTWNRGAEVAGPGYRLTMKICWGQWELTC